jgi:hypothetical protein
MADSDIDLPWAGDFSLTATGDIATVTGAPKVVERLVRRFLTNPQRTDKVGRVINVPDYLFHPQYGGGARVVVDKPITSETFLAIQQRFAQQATLENEVALDPTPVINLTADNVGNMVMDVTVYLTDGTTVTVPGLRIT